MINLTYIPLLKRIRKSGKDRFIINRSSSFLSSADLKRDALISLSQTTAVMFHGRTPFSASGLSFLIINAAPDTIYM